MPVQRLIWGAMAFSTAIYAFIVFIIAGNPAASFDSAFRLPIVVALYVMAAGAFVAGLVIPSLAPARTKMIVGLAIFESAAIFGLMAAFLAHDWRLYLGPWALTLVGFFRLFPTAEAG